MNVFRNCLEWFLRFRYRCGYGVHSPFAFDFITGVVFERGCYYAYQRLDREYPVGCLARFSHVRKCRRFLFRLANYVHPDVFVCYREIPSDEIAYMAAGSCYAEWKGEEALPGLHGKKILFYMNADKNNLFSLLKQLSAIVSSDSALLLRVSSREQREACTKIISDSKYCGITFDLYDYLLVFFDRKRFKQHYKVNFLD